MDTRIPEVVRPLLQAYLDTLAEYAPDLVQGVYVHGSIALDAFDVQHSDIDTLVILNRQATGDDLRQLAAVHARIATQYPRWRLEASYLQAADLGQPEQAVPRHPTYHDNHFDAAGHFDVNPVTWWQLKYKGIALLGPDPQALPFTAGWDAVLDYMHHNLNTYWASFTTQPRRMASLLANEGVAWVVLGVLRQYYSFKEGDITSKVGAGAYALSHVPDEWHGLIRDALDIRQGRAPTHYASRFTRAYAVIRFVRFIIGVCNATV